MTNEPEVTEAKESNGFILSDVTFNRIRRFVQIVLPALGTLYFALGLIWGLEYVEQVLGTIAALSTFLGTALGFSSRNYNNSNMKYSGILEITESADKKTYQLVFDGDVEDIDQLKDVTFKVFNR